MYNIKELLEKDYLDVDEKIYLEDRCEFLFAVWRDLIITNSNKKLTKIEKEKLPILLSAIKEFDLCEHANVVIGKLDRPTILMLLKIAVKLKRISIINFVFKRTKYSAKAMPQYFYPEEIINAYLDLLEIEKAIEVLNYMFKINHRSYLYRIIDIKSEKYKDYPVYSKQFKKIKNMCLVQLIKDGETINIDLDLQTFNDLNQYI